MTDKQKTTLEAVIRTLDTIPVSGAQNMDKLLGCIRALLGILNDGGQETGAGQAAGSASASQASARQAGAGAKGAGAAGTEGGA